MVTDKRQATHRKFGDADRSTPSKLWEKVAI